MTADFQNCRELLDVEDRERALSLVFAPVSVRDDLAALYAFDIEITRIRDRVSEAMPGEIRLQWWRDAILPADGMSTTGHPIADALIEVIERRDLPRGAFDRLLETRIFDLYDDQMPSCTELEGYAGATASTLIMLAARILSPASANLVAEAAGHFGVARTIVATLWSLAFRRASVATFFPADLLAASACTKGELIRGDREPAGRAIRAMIALGNDHAQIANNLLRDVPGNVRPAFLQASLSGSYLARAGREPLALLSRAPDISLLRKSMHYWRAMRA